MTTIFTVSIDSIEGPTLRGKVHIVNPDVPYVPEESVFPLSLLAEVWAFLADGYLRDEDDEERGGDRYPFTEEQGTDIATGMRLKGELAKVFDLVLGRKVRVTADGYLLADDGVTVLKPRRKAEDVHVLDGGSGFDGVSRYVTTHGDEEEFERLAGEIVTAYEAGPYRNVPLRSEVAALADPGTPWDPAEADGPADLDELGVWRILRDRSFSGLPYSEIVVTVADAGYLEHLVAGMRWASTMTGEVCWART